MKHVAAYLLCQLGGNASPSESDIAAVLSSVGGEVDSEKLPKLLSSLEGKDIVEVLAAGRAKMATMPAGGGGGGGGVAVAAAGGAAAAPAGGAAPAAAAKAPEPEPEEEEEEMGFDLFD